MDASEDGDLVAALELYEEQQRIVQASACFRLRYE